MLRFRSLPVIAVRRMLGNWRLLSSVVVGTLVAAAVLSSTAVYSDAIRDLGLDFALTTGDRSELDVRVRQSTIGVGRVPYQRSLERIDSAVATALGNAAGTLVRQGTSATFFPTAPGDDVSPADGRLRGNLRFRSELEQHVALIEGTLPAAMPRAEGRAVPVAIGLETATRNGIAIGQRFDLHPFWDADAEPIPVEVSAIVQAIDATEQYWGSDGEVLDRHTRNWDTIAFHVPESTFFGAMAERLPGIQADYDNLYTVQFDGLNSRNADDVALGIRTLERTLSSTEVRLSVASELVRVLDTYDEKLFFTRIPLLVLLLQIAGIVVYYLVMVSNMLVERQAGEIALLHSRGATTAQLLALYSIEGIILAALAAFAGPPIAGATIATLGLTPAFEGLSGGALLEVNVSTAAYLLAGAGALIAYLALMVPAWRVTHTTMVEFKRAKARPRPTPLFLRYYLDVAFVLAAATVFWQLSQQEQLFTESLFGEMQADPFLLLTPAVFLVTVGVVFLRVFPLVLRVMASLVGRTRSTAILVGMRSLVRNPGHYTRLILLLMFATGVGMFGASFNATLDASYSDRAAYAVGADLRAADFRSISGEGGGRIRQVISDVPAEVTSPVARVGGRLETQAASVNVELLAVDAETFAEVAFFRADFAPEDLAQITATLAANGATPGGIPVPGSPRQIGLWLKAPDIRGRISVGLVLKDANGRIANVPLGVLRPSDEVAEEWRFLTADLLPERSTASALSRLRPLVPPLELTSVFFRPQGRIASDEGTLLFGPVFATEQQPEEGELTGRLAQTFPGGQLVHRFDSLDGLEVISGYSTAPVSDAAIADADAAPAFTGSVKYSWINASRSPPLHGLQVATDGEPTLLYMLRRTARELELEIGDDVTLSVSLRFMHGRLAGVFDYFPTAEISPTGNGFAIVNLDRLTVGINSGPVQQPLMPNEAWYASSAPEALRIALEDESVGAQLVLDLDTELLTQQEDPLVAAGWKGILAIAFGAVLLLSAIGFLVYSYLTAQQRALEFAILRTLGFSRWQIFSVVAFEHVFVIVAGMGLGTVVGLRVGRLMMDFLATDERGREVLPPFVLGVSWPSVFVAWSILGAVFVVTIGAVVLLYFRLQVHRALRLGDV